jgi:pimeloyl-ACP methyl ester carboxylesterase
MLLRLVKESLRTLSVTYVHPVGWSLGWLHKQLRHQAISEEELRIEHNCPVLLVHGIFHNSTAFYAIDRMLKKNGFARLSTLELWTSVSSIEGMARQLKQRVEALAEEHRKAGFEGKVRVVAHSLGGIVLRAALQDLEFARHIDKVIFLGVPHQGNKLFYRLTYPRCVKQLGPRSELMTSLKELPLPGGIQFWNLRGTLDVVTPAADTLLPHIPNLYFEGVGHAGLLSAKRVLQAILAILETPLYDVDLGGVKGTA